MSGNSTLDPDNFPIGRRQGTPKGHDIGSLGPSDSTDSGSDLAGLRRNDDITLNQVDEDGAGFANDIDTDHVVSVYEAGAEPLPSEDRRRRIAEAAYYRAERRGFQPGNEDDDWWDAEREIDSVR